MKNIEIPEEIKMQLEAAAQRYSRSEATTNAGRVLRFLAKFVSVDVIIKLFAHKLG